MCREPMGLTGEKHICIFARNVLIGHLLIARVIPAVIAGVLAGSFISPPPPPVMNQQRQGLLTQMVAH